MKNIIKIILGLMAFNQYTISGIGQSKMKYIIHAQSPWTG